MGHTFTLDLPDDIYEPLITGAKRAGRTPEEMVIVWLTRVAQGLTEDPLLQLAGTFESTLTDVSDRHDDYIGQSLREESRGSDHG